ncbi:Aste57867_8860 [Aphanomyces stellatus]|uniref:Aste57867_8860 protein n=1 Tax=Aphanomyces stellatus TaxID=120398 RepID=A0A485KLC3_9STRA|nr:hypothetical protein As57867_008825 [Aphanomyces stellatus]VFT85746.1 Aste57867_8860 [Aphanomyces stellatus]
MGVLWGLLVVCALLPCASADVKLLRPSPLVSGCRVVVDAGSSATRFFVFISRDGSDDVEMVDTFPHLTPGLSHTPPHNAYGYMKDALHEVQTHVQARDQHTTCHVHIYGTAGMRLLQPAHQMDIYDAIFTSFHADASMTLVLDRKHLQTISDDDEGYFFVLAANFLDKRVGKDLVPSFVELYGVLDLDGASAQVVFDAENRWRHNSRRKSFATSPLTTRDFYIHRFAGYGTDEMEVKVLAQLQTINATENVCNFVGHTDSHGRMGTGDAVGCMTLLRQLVNESNVRCPLQMYCALDSQAQPHLAGGSFYATHVFYAATAFAKDVLTTLPPDDQHWTPFDFPTPLRHEVEQAAVAVCHQSFASLQTLSLTHTPADTLPRRCLDLAYVSVLLAQFGFLDDEKRVVYVDAIQHRRFMDWPLGAFLATEVEGHVEYENAMAEYLSARVDQGLPVGYHLALLVLAFAALALWQTVHRASGRDGTHAMEFVHDASK